MRTRRAEKTIKPTPQEADVIPIAVTLLGVQWYPKRYYATGVVIAGEFKPNHVRRVRVKLWRRVGFHVIARPVMALRRALARRKAVPSA